MLTEADSAGWPLVGCSGNGPRKPLRSKSLSTDPLADARFWAEALNRGAYDLLVQPFHEPEVRRILSNACSRGVNGGLMRAAV